MTKTQRMAAAKKELKRLKDANMKCFWSLEGLEGDPSKPELSIDAEDLDDEPETASEMLRQAADGAMRPLVERALDAYMTRLELIALRG